MSKKLDYDIILNRRKANIEHLIKAYNKKAIFFYLHQVTYDCFDICSKKIKNSVSIKKYDQFFESNLSISYIDYIIFLDARDNELSTILCSFIKHENIIGPAKAVIFKRNKINKFLLFLIKLCLKYRFLYLTLFTIYNSRNISKVYLSFLSFIKKNNLNLSYIRCLIQTNNIPYSDLEFLSRNKITGIIPWPRFEESYYKSWYLEHSDTSDWQEALNSYWKENLEANIHIKDETFSRHTLSANLAETGLMITKRIIDNKKSESKRLVNWLDYGSGLGIIPYATSQNFKDFKITAMDVQDGMLKNSYIKRIKDSKLKKIGIDKITSCDFFSCFEVIEHLYSLSEMKKVINQANPKVILISCPLDEEVPNQPATEHLWSFSKEGLMSLFDKFGYKKVSHISVELLNYRKTQILLAIKNEYSIFSLGFCEEGFDRLNLKN